MTRNWTVLYLAAILLISALRVLADAAAAGLTLQALSAEDLDAIQQNTGYRVGVLVTAVAPGSAADKAGFRARDILLTVGKNGVDAPAAVDKALAAGTGELEVLFLRVENEQFKALKLTLPAGGAAAKPAPDGQIPDREVQEKLKALDAAHEAGILSDEEYARKKAELLKGAPAPDAGQPVFQDPKGDYLLSYPKEWKAQPLPDDLGVVLSKGAVSLTVMRRPSAGGPDAVLQAMLGQLKGQWKELQAGKAADARIGGSAGRSLDFSGVSPNGQRSRARLAAVVLGNAGLTVLLIAPAAEFLGADGAWKAIVGSLRPAGAGAPDKVTEAGEIFRHPVGFQFWHPKGWKVAVTPDGPVQLTPPDVAMRDGQPAELFVVIGQSVAGQGITRADDPVVVAFLDGQVQQLVPAMRRVGEPAPVETSAGQGTVLDWEAQNDRGQTMCIRGYVNILNDHGIALLAIAEKSLLAKRDAGLKRMFASFGVGEGKTDPALAGRWTLLSTYTLTNTSIFETDYSRARMVSDRQTAVSLNADGAWVKVSKYHMIAGGSGVWLESNDTSTERGRWYAEKGWLYLLEEKGGWAQYQYRIEQGPKGRQIKLVDGKQGEIWQEG